MTVAKKIGQNSRWPVPTSMPAPTNTAVEGTKSPMMSSASPNAIKKTMAIAQVGFWAK